MLFAKLTSNIEHEAAMIWFACYKCGEKHGRPDNSAGAMVFCKCGEGLTVPWESTVEPASEGQAGPRLEPVSFPDPPKTPARKERQKAGLQQRDPNLCFNHSHVPSQTTCSDCGEAFCGDCLVVLQGQPMCSPCKNHRLRSFQHQQRMSGLALASIVIALIAVPLPFCFLPLPFTSRHPLLALLPLLPQILALILGVVGLWRIERRKDLGGRAVAMTGIAAALVFGVLSVTLALLAPELAQVRMPP